MCGPGRGGASRPARRTGSARARAPAKDALEASEKGSQLAALAVDKRVVQDVMVMRTTTARSTRARMAAGRRRVLLLRSRRRVVSCGERATHAAPRAWQGAGGEVGGASSD